MKWVILTMALLLWGGCASRRWPESVVPTGDQPAETVIAIPQEASPRLGTNDVLRIAREAAEGRRFKMNEYHCDMVMFQPAPTDSRLFGTWRLYFVTKPPVPDMDFWVMVNDGSGKAEIWVP